MRERADAVALRRMAADEVVRPEGGDMPLRPSGAKRAARRMIAVLKLAISAGIVAYLLDRYAPGRDRLAHVNLALAAFAIPLVLMQILLNTWRWRLILAHDGSRRPSFRPLFDIYYVAAFFTQILPSVGGDVVRVMYFRRLETSVGALVTSVLLDRGLAVAALLLLAFLTAPVLAHFDGGTMPAHVIAAVASSGLGLGYTAAIVVRSVAPGAPRGRLPAAIRTLLRGAAWALTSRTGLFKLMPLSVAIHALSILILFVATRAAGAPIPPATIVAVGPALLFAQVVPISIGGWGVREATALAMFGLAGVDAPSALLASILFGVAVLVGTLPGAVFWLLLRGGPNRDGLRH